MSLETSIEDYKAQVFGQSHTPTHTPTEPETPSVDTPAETVVPSSESTVIEITETPIVEVPATEEVVTPETPATTEAVVEPLATPPTKEELKFANERSEKLYKAFVEGKEDEVLEIIQAKKELSNAANLSAADAIKLQIKHSNPKFKSEDIQDAFEEKFATPPQPKEPVQRATELDAEFEERLDEYKTSLATWEQYKAKVDRRIELAGELAKDELAKLNDELVLPKIESQQDENYQSWVAQQEAIAEIKAQEKVAYAKYTPKDIGLNFTFTDKANKLDLKFDFQPDEKGFAKAVNDASELDNFFQNFRGEDGSPQRDKFLKAVYISQNIDKIVTQAVTQATNQTRVQMIARQKNISNIYEKNYNVIAPSELDNLKKQVFG
jgi:hypothetical protein